MVYSFDYGVKMGWMVNAKRNWELVLHSTKIGNNVVGARNAAIYIGNKAAAILVRAKLNNVYFGKLNYDLTLQVILISYRTFIPIVTYLISMLDLNLILTHDCF